MVTHLLCGDLFGFVEGLARICPFSFCFWVPVLNCTLLITFCKIGMTSVTSDLNSILATINPKTRLLSFLQN
jgi:hypothetical protein